MMTTVTIDPAVVSARRELIKQDAPCEGCGATLASCEANRGKDPTAPVWFGCCARGAALDVPCRHVPDPGDLAALLREIEAGEVRTAEEVTAERRTRETERATLRAAHITPDGRMLTLAAKFRQGEWWRTKDGQWLRITEMEERHRRNTAAMLLRMAGRYAEVVAWSEFGDLSGPFGDAPDDVVDDVLREQSARGRDPQAWITGTPLYRALTDGLDAS
jgi:hypothetical protein